MTRRQPSSVSKQVLACTHRGPTWLRCVKGKRSPQALLSTLRRGAPKPCFQLFALSSNVYPHNSVENLNNRSGEGYRHQRQITPHSTATVRYPSPKVSVTHPIQKPSATGALVSSPTLKPLPPLFSEPAATFGGQPHRAAGDFVRLHESAAPLHGLSRRLRISGQPGPRPNDPGLTLLPYF